MSPTYADLNLVNAKVNLLPYVAEVGDDWTPITEAGGDCDSYATAKYERLVALGWPRQWLRLATCWVEDGIGYHAVLLADDADGQTWVLDNRHGRPVEFQLLKYRWHKLQIAGTNRWELA